jgi:antitoxin component of RelBE/YafQ-DinJ toxin-antitoxin module
MNTPTTKDNKTEIIMTRLDLKTKRKLEKRAKELGISMAALIRMLANSANQLKVNIESDNDDQEG